jgi:hypothetical protein
MSLLMRGTNCLAFTVRRSATLPFHRTGCDIKGNINERGEHIFHAPSQEYHLATRIDPARGERWFCSQWEVWWAGWRKVKV